MKTINLVEGLGKYKKWHFMEENGFKKSLIHSTHYNDVINILKVLKIKYSIENDAPRKGVNGNHLSLCRVNNLLKKRIISILNKKG